MNERLDRFTKLLKEIFELDKSDLDFGIYRVMNLRKAQIEQFLTERLPQMVQETLAPFAQGSKEEIRAKMKQIEDSVSEMGMTVDALPDTAQKKQQYLQLQKQLAEGADLAALETDVYSALYSFFNRYYEDGDFISKRRYKEGVYAIPYEGEEVKLYWANQDQYYIKTSENFKDYTFVFDGITVHFRLVDATTEQNNNKESKDSKRTFMLFTEDEENYPGIKRFEYDPETAEIVIRFVYDIPEDKKKKYAEENYAAITAWLLSQHRAELNPLIAPIPTGKGRETTTLLEKHLKGYVAKNTFDYFIHKDLHGFLTRELDFFIKSEVMHLEDLDTGSEARVETYLAKVKAIKRVGKIIIDFLAQIEDFQKKLWLKKKFVVETNWCITLDKIDESFWPEIIGNKAQIDEWIAMYAIDEAEGWTNPPSIDFLRLNQNLIIDTKHFSNTFKFKLLESIPDLDEQTIGLLINGDNYHAIRLLQKVYGSSIRCTYIDPPYNSPSSEVLYKNSYKHSAWLTLMHSRLIEGQRLQSEDGAVVIAIDKYEHNWLFDLCKDIFPEDDVVSVAIEHNKKGTQGDHFSYSNEYAVFVVPMAMKTLNEVMRPESEWEYSAFRNWGSESERADAANCFYPVYIQNGVVVGYGDVLSDEIHPDAPNQVIVGELKCFVPNEQGSVTLSGSKDNPVIAVWPIDDEGVERKWRYMDKFFKYEKERWEAPRLEYAILDADDSNFVDEYTLTYAQQSAMDPIGDELEAFVAEMSAVLQANNGLDVYKKDSFHGKLVLFDFRSHLYAPLICLEKSNLKIQLSPVALNTDEMRFVDYLKAYVDNHAAELVDKSLYLLRNKSKVGMGFFEAGNFYPDYILWIDTPETQYISFIDPKGLMHIRPDDPKIEFYKTIKDLETRLSPTADGKRIVLNSFIMAGTRSSDLRMWWSTPEVDADRAYREARNVYTLDNDECVESMMRKILQ